MSVVGRLVPVRASLRVRCPSRFLLWAPWLRVPAELGAQPGLDVTLSTLCRHPARLDGGGGGQDGGGQGASRWMRGGFRAGAALLGPDQVGLRGILPGPSQGREHGVDVEVVAGRSAGPEAASPRCCLALRKLNSIWERSRWMR